MTTPSQRDWTCIAPSCRAVLGFTTAAGDLVITLPGTLIELGRLAVVVRCPCGQGKAFSGRAVRVNVPDEPAKEAA